MKKIILVIYIYTTQPKLTSIGFAQGIDLAHKIIIQTQLQSSMGGHEASANKYYSLPLCSYV